MRPITHDVLALLDDDEDLDIMALLAVLLSGALEAYDSRVERRNPRRLYLCRSNLLPNPRADTPWQVLWESQSDRAFVTTMGVNVETFMRILCCPGGFQEQWMGNTIPRQDVMEIGAPRLRRRSLNAAGALGLVLHYYNSTMAELGLQQIFALTPTVLSRYLEFSQTVLLITLRAIPEGDIRMPAGVNAYQDLADLISARHPLLEGAFGSIDGLSLPVQESTDPELENATYNGWKCEHRINNIIVFSPTGLIIDAVMNAPGSWHDSRVARPIYKRLRDDVPEGFYLIADTAFPRAPQALGGKIRAPLKDGDHVPIDPGQQDDVLRLSRELVSYRQTAEWGMRMLQGSFGRLRMPLPISNPEARKRTLENCFRLSNVRTQCVGINQIKTVYMPIWRASEDERLWSDLGSMMFGDIRRNDRVSRYHVIVNQ